MISVCVPFWNAQSDLDRTIEMYGSLYPDIDIEFSVCDDGSTVPADVNATKMAVDHKCVITRLEAKTCPLNPCIPINRAVDASSGDIIVVTGTDIRHDEPILREMLGRLDDEDDYMIAQCRHESADLMNGMWLAGPSVNYNSGGREPVPPGGHFHFLVMFYRSLWEKAGGFDEAYRYGQACDDNDWLWRVYEAGARFKITKCVAWHSRNGKSNWGLPHNRDLFHRKWPLARRESVINARKRRALLIAQFKLEPEHDE